jgi:transposase
VDKRELSMYKLRDIVEELLNGTGIKTIARMQKISKNTIKRYRGILETILENQSELASNIDRIMEQFQLLRKQNKYSVNFEWLENHETLINKLSLKSDNYFILYPQLVEHGYQGSYSSLLRYINKYRETKDAPVYRIETKPGEYAQVDFGYMGLIFDPVTGKEEKAWVFVMVLCYSRHAYYEIVRNQDVETWCFCHIHAFEFFGGVPCIIIPDNLKSGILKASFTDPVINKSYADLATHYGFQVDPCLPGVPEHKGKVESGVKYVKNNFLPFKTFTSFHDANRQLKEWNKTCASVRTHGTTRRQPIDLFRTYEKQQMKPVIAERFEIPEYKRLKVARDIHIQFDYAYYSVPYELRGEYVIARKTRSQVTIFKDGIDLVAVHPVVQKGKRQTQMVHYPPDEDNYLRNDTSYCLKTAQGIGESTHRIVKELLEGGVIRNLRGTQNILRLSKKYGCERLENACKRAERFGNYEYHSIKNILEKEIDKQLVLPLEKSQEKQLTAYYAVDMKEFLKEMNRNGDICTN